MTKERIAYDIDDVIADHNAVLAGFMLERYGEQHPPDAYHGQFSTLWNVGVDEAVERMWEFTRANLHPTFELVPGALETITRQKSQYEEIGLSAQPKEIEEVKTAWLERVCPGLLSRVVYINPYEGDYRSKGDVCVEEGVDILVDNSFKHCRGAARLGVTAVLFGNQPFSDEAEELDIVPARDMSELDRYLDERYAARI